MSNSKTVNASVRAILENVCKTFNKVGEAQAALNEKRMGSYSGMIAAAIEAGTIEAFRGTYESLKADVSENVGNIGRKLGCKLGKADKEGNARYVMPSGMMSAASVIGAAMEYGIALKDDKGEPRSFNEIRQAKAEADKAKADATRSPLQKAQAAVKAALLSLAENVDAMTQQDCDESLKILASLAKLQTGEATEPKAAAKKAA